MFKEKLMTLLREEPGRASWWPWRVSKGVVQWDESEIRRPGIVFEHRDTGKLMFMPLTRRSWQNHYAQWRN